MYEDQNGYKKVFEHKVSALFGPVNEPDIADSSSALYTRFCILQIDEQTEYIRVKDDFHELKTVTCKFGIRIEFAGVYFECVCVVNQGYLNIVTSKISLFLYH